MNVLSLFDGMSCGQIALNRAGIKYDKYYACEIKKHGIDVTQHNYPNTIQLGDVIKVDFQVLPKIDLLIGGSPCQDFSRANKDRLGLRGDKSSLFYYYLKALDVCNPKYFLLENVIMDSDQCILINNALNCFPVRINSELVSAQLRDRLYWTNIPGDDIPDMFGRSIEQPKDKKIMLGDIIESGFVDKNKSRCLLESESRPLRNPKRMLHRYIETGMTQIVYEKKEIMELAKTKRKGWGNDDYEVKEGDIRYFNQKELEKLQTVPEGYTSILKRNNAACLLGDGWTVDVIAHIFKGLK
jgi:hypothetical protein